MIHTCRTRTLIEEVKTDGHSPMKFLCDDGELYYCKYLIRSKTEELDFLAYEVISHFLLKATAIPTPEIALVEVLDGSYKPAQLRANRRHLRPGVICFGSRALPNADLVRQTEAICSGRTFRTLLNPTDLIRIAVFDLWTDNIDRGRGFGSGVNYNLLRVPVNGKTQFVAFDNAFTFGGENGLRIFTPNLPQSASSQLFTSPYYRAVVQHITPKRRFTVATECVALCYERAEQTLQEAFDTIPASWATLPSLKQRMESFLLNAGRRDRIEALVNQYLQF